MITIIKANKGWYVHTLARLHLPATVYSTRREPIIAWELRHHIEDETGTRVHPITISGKHTSDKPWVYERPDGSYILNDDKTTFDNNYELVQHLKKSEGWP